MNFKKDFQFREVRRRDNLVDLEKCWKMSIWLQKSALIQPRTSPLKFAHLAEKSEKDPVPNLSTKVRLSKPNGGGAVRNERRRIPGAAGHLPLRRFERCFFDWGRRSGKG